MSQLDYLTLPRKTDPQPEPLDPLPTDAPAPPEPYTGWSSVCAQVGHRAGSVGLILLLAGAGALAAGKASAPLLLWAFGAADLGLLGAFLSLVSQRRAGHPGREARGVLWFNAVVVTTALVLYVLARWLRGT